jgi:hypothetical protein
MIPQWLPRWDRYPPAHPVRCPLSSWPGSTPRPKRSVRLLRQVAYRARCTKRVGRSSDAPVNWVLRRTTCSWWVRTPGSHNKPRQSARASVVCRANVGGGPRRRVSGFYGMTGRSVALRYAPVLARRGHRRDRRAERGTHRRAGEAWGSARSSCRRPSKTSTQAPESVSSGTVRMS